MEDDCEIEYLDEDEDIVQQCVQTVHTFPSPVVESVRALKTISDLTDHDIEDQIPLLVERKRDHKRKKSEDDSDYDPNDDLEQLREEQARKKRKLNKKNFFTFKINRDTNKKLQVPQQIAPQLNKQSVSHLNKPTLVKTYENKLKNLPHLTVQKKTVPKVPEQKTYKTTVKKENLNERRKLNIMIPDYEDALCLPVRAIKGNDYDYKKLRLWNNLCLEHCKKAETTLTPNKGDGVKSTRTIVLRNVKNKYTGKLDTSIFGKTTVENAWGETKTESFQGTLPKYREKKTVLNNYPLLIGSTRNFKHTYEAILTKENQKNDEQLVVYKPKEAISAVYKFINENKSESLDEDMPRDEMRVLKEATCCKMCAPCYQASWRGVRKDNKKDSLKCPICSRTFVSVYNLLTHLNTNHTAKDVGKYKAKLSKTLASMVEYHYRCKICQEKFNSIKLLRKHVPKHQGVDVFKCEVGNHMAS